MPILSTPPSPNLISELIDYWDKRTKNGQIQPILERISHDIRELFHQQPLLMLREDLIKQVFDQKISSDQRKKLGSFYSPSELCSLIIDLTVKDPTDLVLDPSVGGGAFLIPAYRKIRDLRREQGLSYDHQTILSQLNGVDVSPFSIYLTIINLVLQDLDAETHPLNLEIADFLEIKSNKSRYDVIIGNPPYIRHEKISNKNHVRNHLNFLPPTETNNWPHLIDKKSDLFVYFFTHAVNFLALGNDIRPPGRLTFITSERWLDASYGTGLQRFLLSHFRILGIISFDKQVFKDALIDTCITVLERATTPLIRESNTTKFIQIKKPLNTKDIVSLLYTPLKPESRKETDYFNIVTKSQHSLYKAKKWRIFLHAPSLYFDLFDSPLLVSLGSIAKIQRGITSGANGFFYKRKQELETLNLDLNYFCPLVKAIGQQDYLSFYPRDTTWYVLDLHRLIAPIKKEWSKESEQMRNSTKLEDYVKTELLEQGHDNLLKYISWGESKAFHTRTTCQSRQVWFDLGELDSSSLAFPKEYWAKFLCPITDKQLAFDNRVYLIHPKDQSSEFCETLAGILNSDLTAMFYELQGRIYAGEGLNRSCMTVYEAKQLKVINPLKLANSQKQKIRIAFLAIIEKERSLIPPKSDGAFFEIKSNTQKQINSQKELLLLRHQLNKAVLAALGIEKRIDELEGSIRHLLNLRRKAGAKNKQMLIWDEH